MNSHLRCLGLRLALAFALAACLRAAADDAPAASYAERRAAIDRDHAASVARAIDLAAEQAQQMQVKARRSGNVTAQAVAKTAVKIAADAKAAAAKGESPEIPANIRRELAEWAGDLRKGLAAADATRDSAVEALKEEFGGEPEEPDTDTDADAGEGGVDAASGDADPAAAPVPAIPPSASGDAPAWVPVAHVTIECDGMEMVEIPVAGIAEPFRKEEQSHTSGQTVAIDWKPVNELIVADTAPVFRAVPENGREVDVTEWPRHANGYRMEVRVRPDPEGAPLAFLLEAGEGTAGFRAVAQAAGEEPGEQGEGDQGAGDSGAEKAADAPRVKVRFESDPAGAVVVIDGRPLARGGRALLTPFDASIPAAEAKEICFRKRGFFDATYANVTPKEGATLKGRLKADPRFVDKRMQVRANSMAWQLSEVKVKKGQKIAVEALGKWQCGGELMADATGYPNDDKCFAYYLDPKKYPRVTLDSNFGCLMVKVAPDGAPRAFDSLRMAFTADADGAVAFDLNEEKAARRDNRGSITVRIQAAP